MLSATPTIYFCSAASPTAPPNQNSLILEYGHTSPNLSKIWILQKAKHRPIAYRPSLTKTPNFATLGTAQPQKIIISIFFATTCGFHILHISGFEIFLSALAQLPA